MSKQKKTGIVKIIHCGENPKGRELWLDDVRWLLEKGQPHDMDPGMSNMVLQQIVMLMTDRERFVTYLNIVAEKI